MDDMTELRITIWRDTSGEGFKTEIWCNAFVDRESTETIEEGLDWAKNRLRGVDPYVEWKED